MNYVPIRLSTLRTGVPLNFNVFLKLTEKYLLYVREGDDFAHNRYQSLKSKKVRQLFISDEDEPNYQQFLDQALMEAAESTTMSGEEKAGIASGQAQGAVEDFFDNPADAQTYKFTEKAADGLIKIVAKNKDVLKSVLSRGASPDEDKHFRHTVNVASLAATLGEKLGFAGKDLQDLGTAGLIMDIGKSAMDEGAHELFLKDHRKMPQEELKLYKTHPKLGYDLMADKEFVNPEILGLILRHEERKSGEGFPEGLQKLSLQDECMGVCVAFDRRVTLFGLTHNEAIKELQVDELGNFELSLIKKLKEVLKEQSVVS